MKLASLAPIIALCLMVHPAAAIAGGKKGGKDEREKAKSFTPEQAAKSARRQSGGRVLNVKPDKEGYRVKVLTPKGEVLYVPVDPPRR